MTETLEYKGHTITADTQEMGHGYQWSYRIDGGPIRTGKDRPLKNEKIMLSEAIDNAKHEIDSMN